ncbi:thiopurine S-methyltransferase isoform X3 [Oxyura jamaicensis]|uniref:thiopurine S-methyltransferase isoform X3 n=1 Tax=Oxyura jamaicensis TaxID=8884 RepID=UPI0015A5BBB0|nr:thiopurine S-methyltransferase isoform X3 [Oxyura jamaicensis]
MDGPAGVPAELQGPQAQKDRVLTAQEWLHKWETGTAAFHKEHGHPLLGKYLDVLLSGRSGLRILFPLCGKAVDMKRLADLGHSIVGVDISEQALKEFFADQSLSYCEEPVPGIAGAKKLQSTSGNICLYCCSIYDLSSYASLMISLMEKNSSYLLVTVLYDPNKHKGPPFYVPESEVKSLFGNHCEIKLLEKVSDFSDRHRQWGLDYFLEVLYILKFVA